MRLRGPVNGRVHGKERSRMTNKKVTIKDVANDSGVSITTVSQILNGNGARFSGKTVEKVLAAKERLNYQPDYFAQRMVMKK